MTDIEAQRFIVKDNSGITRVTLDATPNNTAFPSLITIDGYAKINDPVTINGECDAKTFIVTNRILFFEAPNPSVSENPNPSISASDGTVPIPIPSPIPRPPIPPGEIEFRPPKIILSSARGGTAEIGGDCFAGRLMARGDCEAQRFLARGDCAATSGKSGRPISAPFVWLPCSQLMLMPSLKAKKRLMLILEPLPLAPLSPSSFYLCCPGLGM